MHDGVGVSFSGTYGLPSACARVTILCTQVVGHPHGRSARAPVHDPRLVGHAPLLRCIMHHPLVPLGLGLCLSLLCDHYGCSLFCLFVLSACACSSDVTVTSYSHSPSVSLRAVVVLNTTQRSLFNQRRVLLAPPAPKPAAMRQRVVVVVTREPQWLSRCVGLINKLLRRERERALFTNMCSLCLACAQAAAMRTHVAGLLAVSMQPTLSLFTVTERYSLNAQKGVGGIRRALRSEPS